MVKYVDGWLAQCVRPKSDHFPKAVVSKAAKTGIQTLRDERKDSTLSAIKRNKSQIFTSGDQTCKETIFFYTNMVGAKNILPEKCVNYNKCNLRQNSVKGPKDPNSAKQYQKAT